MGAGQISERFSGYTAMDSAGSRIRLVDCLFGGRISAIVPAVADLNWGLKS